MGGSDAVARLGAPVQAYWSLNVYEAAAEAGGCFVSSLRRAGGTGPVAGGVDPDRSAVEAGRRARARLRRYCVSNRLNRLVTLTYAGEGCHDPRQVPVDVGEFFRALRTSLGGDPFADRCQNALMSPADVAAWVSAVCALVSLVAAGVAWWRTNLSRRAREEAETARDASQRNLASMEKIARAAEGPPLIVRGGEPNFVLSSNRSGALTIEALLNSDDFVMRSDIDLPKTLPGFGSLPFMAIAVWGGPIPVEMVLSVTELGTVHVPMPQTD
jgi:hypothetical protein